MNLLASKCPTNRSSPTLPSYISSYLRSFLPWNAKYLAMNAIKSQALIWFHWQVQSRTIWCLGKCECPLSPAHPGRSSRETLPTINDACINIMLSMLRQYRQGTLAPCKIFVLGFFSASSLLWALGGSMLRIIPFGLIFGRQSIMVMSSLPLIGPFRMPSFLLFTIFCCCCHVGPQLRDW